MNNQLMQVTLSEQAADPRWGKCALLSSSAHGITLHVPSSEPLRAIQRAGKKLADQGILSVELNGAWDLASCWAFWMGYRQPKRRGRIVWPALRAEEGEILQRRLTTVDWVRDCINQSAEALGPTCLAQRAADLIQQCAGDAVSSQIIAGEALSQLGYHGLYSVGRGSQRPPALLMLDYNPGNKANAPVHTCLVGKGITFDSGGYSLKQSQFMDSMKADMGGAALLTGALALAILHGLKRRVKLFLCCADNMVSGAALKLGDIIHYRNGKCVEVMNSDAEGRLVLADGLIDADKAQPQFIIDAATLTGAAKTALGNDYHALFTFDDALAQRLLACAADEDELFWRLPLAEFHRQHLPSHFADLSNISAAAHTAGASDAAAFLSWFVKDYRTGWLHIDCSATYRKSAVDLWSAGATGVGVRTLARFLLA